MSLEADWNAERDARLLAQEELRIATKAKELARWELKEFRDKLAALAAIEIYIAESGENAARNIKDLLAGTGADGNDPRVQARAWGLEW